MKPSQQIFGVAYFASLPTGEARRRAAPPPRAGQRRDAAPLGLPTGLRASPPRIRPVARDAASAQRRCHGFSARPAGPLPSASVRGRHTRRRGCDRATKLVAAAVIVRHLRTPSRAATACLAHSPPGLGAPAQGSPNKGSCVACAGRESIGRRRRRAAAAAAPGPLRMPASSLLGGAGGGRAAPREVAGARTTTCASKAATPQPCVHGSHRG